MAEIDNAIGQAMERALIACKDEIIARHLAAGQKASGATAASLSVVKVGSMHYQLVQTGGAPLGTLDEGRKGGKIPKGFAAIVQKWADAKGISFPNVKEANRFARAVAFKIAKEGTQRSHAPVDIVGTPVENLRKSIAAEIAPIYKGEVMRQIFRTDFNK